MKNETPDPLTIWSTVIAAGLLFPVSLWLRANYADDINGGYIQFVGWIVSLFS